jgi:quercetin dioxygenase-like cupin family protein
MNIASKGLRLLPSALWALATAGTGVGSTRHVTRCGIGIRGHGEEEPFSLWFCPVRELMLSAGLLFRLRFSWSASLVKLGFFAFLQFRQLPLQIVRCRRASRGIANKEENGMPTIAGFDQLASVAEEQITDKIGRRVISGKQGTMVYWRMKAGAHAAGHQHPQEQFVWLIKGAIRLRIGAEERAVKPGDIAVIPGGVEHEAFFPEDTEVIDFFAPVRADFLTSEVPSYMAQR